MLVAHKPLITIDSLAELEFKELAKFNAGATGVFWSSPGDYSPWEMHPECDEMLFIFAGEVEIEVLPIEQGESEKIRAGGGSFVVIPTGCWHRQKILSRMQQLYLTPGPSLHSTSHDPRQD